MSATTNLAVIGASGRMGRSVLQDALESERFSVCAAVTHKDSPLIGESLYPSTPPLSANLEEAIRSCAVYIDFSRPQATAEAAQLAAQTPTPAVIGTTGMNDDQWGAVSTLSKVAPVLHATNFSPGVALLHNLAKRAAAALGPDYDLEVVEVHHGQKLDAPSGTALSLAEALAEGRSLPFPSCLKHSRENDRKVRDSEQIGIVALRGGGVIGDHSAHYLGRDERLEITHRAIDRRVFSRGALRVATWLVKQPPGLYTMDDFLGV